MALNCGKVLDNGNWILVWVFMLWVTPMQVKVVQWYSINLVTNGP